ncbi:Ig-like domain-containing protein [Aeromicrobium sp. IC_218]|uniref:Ig-like domain-containing protein n=1 Tax=Aeromicrobium sp. IC_218 TaxID=2545468 RepID=UPI00103F1B83|nr:Ig-like domain-containing protein [Aeromicrobium sp. IC_218]TCI97437.1 Ig-like domain repeat protein [Aeromicrobium sp. IC_218]
MSTTPNPRRRLALSVAAAVAASGLVAGAPSTAHAAPAPVGTTVDYFDDVYDALGAGSVFETVTIERFEYLLKQPGRFAFLVGDPGNASTQATIGHVNQVAKRLGVDKVYNFTPKLDGDTLDVWDLSRSGLRTGTSPDPAGGNRAGQGRAQYEALGNRLLTDYLNKDTTPQFTKDESTDPYLFVYDKDHTEGGAEDRIIASLAGEKSATDLDTPAETTAYEDQVEDVLGAVPASSYTPRSNFQFLKDEVNRRHTTTAAYADASKFGGDILDDADATDGWRVQTVTYPELVHLLQQPGDIPILFGGTWCHNTRAIIKDVNRIAQEDGIRTVYNFDFSLDSTGNSGSLAQHIRDNALPATVDGVTEVLRPSHLYGDLVNTYLSNAVTEYRTAADVEKLGGSVNAVSYLPGGDVTATAKQARKIQVGHVLTYNKDHKDAAGNAAPVVDQAIRFNDDGGQTEHMTEWWYVAGRDYAAGDARLGGTYNVASEAGSNGLQNQRAFAKEAIAEIDSVLGGLAGEEHGTQVAVDGVPATVPVGATPTVQVSVTSPGHAPFASFNTASASVAPSTGTARPRGEVGVFDGSELLVKARLSRAGTASLTLPAQTQGTKAYTVRYLGRGDSLTPSQSALALDVAGTASSVTLAGPAPLTYGAASTVTATVTEGATGTVSLSGLPGGAVSAPVQDGTATFTVPAGTVPGSYALTASYGGDATYAPSSSTPLTVVVRKNASTLAVAAAGVRYGTAAKVLVAVKGAAGRVPTGTVTLTGPTVRATGRLDASGRATIVLPRGLRVGTHRITAVYQGDRVALAASRTGSVTVVKALPGATRVAVPRSVKATRKAKVTITVATPPGLAKASGPVTVKVTKGRTSRTVRATLSNGRVVVTLPRLARGTWSVKAAYAGDASYTAGRTASARLRVVR